MTADMSPEKLRAWGARAGWPWDRLADAEAAVLEASRLAEAALASGTDEDRRVAAFELEGAILRRDHEREHCGDCFLLLFGCALEAKVHEVFAKVMDAAVRMDWRQRVGEYMRDVKGSADYLLYTFAGIEGRLLALERAVAELEASRVA